MSRKVLLTVMGLYNWDNSILEGLLTALPSPAKIPSAAYPDLFYPGKEIDKEEFTQNLLMETAAFEVLYTDADFLKMAISAWAKKEAEKWQLLYNTQYYKYNPIWNKDGLITRTETETRDLKNSRTQDSEKSMDRDITTTRNLTDKGTQDSTQTNNITETTTNNLTDDTTQTIDRTDERKVAGFNSETYVNAEQTTTDSSITSTTENTGTVERKNAGTITVGNETSRTQTGTVDENGTEKETEQITAGGTETGTVTREYTDKETGNIGITMTQQMIDAERITANYNVQDAIIESFKKRFCLLIY